MEALLSCGKRVVGAGGDPFVGDLRRVTQVYRGRASKGAADVEDPEPHESAQVSPPAGVITHRGKGLHQRAGTPVKPLVFDEVRE